MSPSVSEHEIVPVWFRVLLLGVKGTLRHSCMPAFDESLHSHTGPHRSSYWG
jgi:hypothetical protein